MSVIERCPATRLTMADLSALERAEEERDDLASRLRREGEELGEARRQLRGAVAFTPLERDALLGLVSMIANDGLDTYGLSGKEQAAVGRALAKLARRQ